MKHDYMNDPSISDKWKFRFSFLDKNGVPGFWGNTPEWKAAYKKLTFGQRLKVAMNFYALFFSVIYLLILGLWKKAVVIILLQILVGFIVFLTDFGWLGSVVSLWVAFRTNIWYYQKVVLKQQDWGL